MRTHDKGIEQYAKSEANPSKIRKKYYVSFLLITCGHQVMQFLCLGDLINIEPTTAHADSTIPLLEHLFALLGSDFGLKDHAVLLVDGLELAELLPDVDGETSGDCGSQGGGFAHSGAVDRDTDDVCLCLVWKSVICISGCNVLAKLTCMQMFELLIPPSTAKSDRACPLSFSMASRIAFVWKQVASRVARAM